MTRREDEQSDPGCNTTTGSRHRICLLPFELIEPLRMCIALGLSLYFPSNLATRCLRRIVNRVELLLVSMNLPRSASTSDEALRLATPVL